ncbi:hypothetical protein G6F41_013809 [Rhizopus arrhizus]|nr:hypothetical protein G6F41_013809 [Rhizopus arrhizus]
MDQQIESLQQELVDIAALKAGIRWREHGEKSAGYLKRIHQVRTVEQSINCLQDTTSGSTVSSRTQLLKVSQAFYQELYSVDPVDKHDIDCYLQDLADLSQLNEADRRYLISPITIEDIIEQSKKVIGKQSSPGSDGLGSYYQDIQHGASYWFLSFIMARFTCTITAKERGSLYPKKLETNFLDQL